ncbi:MAG: PAS domain S-box protein [Tildeniella nuda ZEHNDER 1965/U140]|jgi:PAS domain S-box-containing protein|nr:PAS domain S-box protein [Tildeniella nuda ZEHNDER 1965/U140]
MSFPRRSSRKIPLLAVLVVPFAIQVLTAVGLAGYLSYRNGQQIVSNLAEQLAAEVGNRIEQNIVRDLRVPAEMTRNAAAAMQLGLLHSRDRRLLQRLFEQQLKSFDGVNAIAIADEHQKLFAVEKQRDGSIAVRVQTQASDDVLNRYLTNSSTTYTPPPVGILGQEHSRLDSWYAAAKLTQKPLWRLAEGMTAGGQPMLTAVNVQPLYDRANSFQGVLASSVSLSNLGSALRGLKIAKTGQAFIVEQSGLLVANSNGDRPFRQRRLTNDAFTKEQLVAAVGSTQPPVFYQRLSAVKSHDFLTERAALSVVERFGGFDRIQTTQQFSFEVDSQRYFVHIEPLGRDEDLDWLAVVVVPESDFIDAIDSNHRLTLLLCAGALTAAVIVGWLTSSWIARPILRLSRASRELALGKWSHPIDSQHQVAELEVLAHSFNQMTVHLQESFDQVTMALQESEAKFTKVFRASPDAISITTLPERRYIDVNDRFVEFSGYTRQEAIGQSALSLNLVVSLEQVARFEQALQTQNHVHDVEIDYRTKQGQLRTVLVSAEAIELEGQPRLLCIYRDVTLRKQLELALQRSETKLNDVLNSAIASITSIHVFPDGTWYYDYWSKGCETVFGYTPSEFMADQRLWLTRVPPEDLERVVVVNPKLLQEQQPFVTQYRFRHKDGTLRWISGYVTSRWDASLNAWIATAVDVDVSSTMRMEAERQQAEAALREAQRVAHIGSWDCDAIAQTTWWSEELFQIHGLDPKQPLPSPVETLQLIHPDDLAVFKALTEQAIADGKAYEKDLRIVRPDGSIRFVQVQGMPLFDEQGTCIRMVGTTLDITERKQAEEALRESEQRFRTAFDTTAVSMCLTSPAGQFLQVNASLCQMLGYTEAELLRLTFAELTHPDDLTVTLEYAQKLLAGDIAYYHLEKRYQHKNGQTIWCLLSVSLVRDRDQQPLYFVAQMQDTTAQQAALYERQRAEASMQAVNAALNQRVAELSTLNHSPEQVQLRQEATQTQHD